MSLFALRHTTEGQSALAEMLARKYVRRGALWLNKNAPRGWFRNCSNNGASRIYTDSTTNESVLEIVFEYHKRFTDKSGYVNIGKTLRHFNLWPFSRAVYRLGFQTRHGEFQPFYKHYAGIVITSKMLDLAWADKLRNPPAEWEIPYRHRTALDIRYAAMSFIDDVPRFSFWRWFRNLFRNKHKLATF